MSSRLDNFKGSDAQYLQYLERLILEYRAQLQISAEVEERSPQVPAQSRKRRRSLEIEHWNPAGAPGPRKKPPWTNLAQKLVMEIPEAKDWTEALKENGLHELMTSGKAVAYLLATSYGAGRSLWQTDLVPAEVEDGPEVVRRVKQYAQATVQMDVTAVAAVMLANFQKFLLYSLCVVLRETGVPVSEVYDTMRICLGNVKQETCWRTLRAAIYMNQVIDSLYMDGWGLRASELFLLCTCYLSCGSII